MSQKATVVIELEARELPDVLELRLAGAPRDTTWRVKEVKRDA